MMGAPETKYDYCRSVVMFALTLSHTIGMLET